MVRPKIPSQKYSGVQTLEKTRQAVRQRLLDIFATILPINEAKAAVTRV